MVYHIPALLKESIEGLNIKPDGIYVDVTFGGGGHSKAILEHLENGRLVAFDQDKDAEVNVPDNPKILFLNQNFRFLVNNLRFNGIDAVDGIIADLGVSFHQFDEAERGFTFRQDAPLDMRMNRQAGKSAQDLLNSLEEERLASLFYNYGELQNSRRIARAIIEARSIRKIDTVNDLLDICSRFAPPRQEHKFYAKLFQALRIEVNHEMEYLSEMLEQALAVLKPGGRLVVLTYHSLEDRIVKNFMKTGNCEGLESKDFFGNSDTPFRLVNRKGTVPGDEEIAANSRSRSARLRIAEKI